MNLKLEVEGVMLNVVSGNELEKDTFWREMDEEMQCISREE